MLISAGGLLPSNHTRSFSTTNTHAAASNGYLTHELAINSRSSNEAEAAALATPATLVDEAVASRTLVSLALTKAAAEVTSLPTAPTGAHATHATFRRR